MKKAIILYFVAFPHKPDEEAQAAFDAHIKAAQQSGARLRDANAYHEGDTLENFDEVAGPDIPEAYKAKAEGREPVAAEPANETSTPDYENMSATELKEVLTEKGIPFAGNASTEVLLETLKASLGTTE